MTKEKAKKQFVKVKTTEHDDFLLPPKPSPEYHAAYHETSPKHEDPVAAAISANLHELEALQQEIEQSKKSKESKTKGMTKPGIFTSLFRKKAVVDEPPLPEKSKNPTRDFLSAIKMKKKDDNEEMKSSVVMSGKEGLQKKELRELQQQLKRDKTDLDREQYTIVKKIKQLEKDQEDLDNREREFLATLERIEVEKRSLDVKQKQELRELQQQKLQFQKSLEKVNAYEQQLRQKEEVLSLKDEELKLREQDLRTTKIALDKEEENIVAKFNEIKETKMMLDKEQEALLREITRLENDQTILDEKEKEILDLIAQLDEQKRDQEQRKLELDARESELLERENKSKEKAAQLQKELERVKVLKDKVQELEKLEATYERLKKRLSHGYNQLEQKFKKEHHLDDAAVMSNPSVVNKNDVDHPEGALFTAALPPEQVLSSMMQSVRNAMQKGDLVKARQQIQQLFDRCYQLDEQAKRNAYYLIRSLENELKMKELGV